MITPDTNRPLAILLEEYAELSAASKIADRQLAELHSD